MQMICPLAVYNTYICNWKVWLSHLLNWLPMLMHLTSVSTVATNTSLEWVWLHSNAVHVCPNRWTSLYLHCKVKSITWQHRRPSAHLFLPKSKEYNVPNWSMATNQLPWLPNATLVNGTRRPWAVKPILVLLIPRTNLQNVLILNCARWTDPNLTHLSV